MTAVWVTGIPDPWVLLGFQEFFQANLAAQVHEALSFYDHLYRFFYKGLLYTGLLTPITFLYALKTVPKRLTFTESGVTATFLFSSQTYPYHQISKISFLEKTNGNPFLRLKIGKRTLNLEVTFGQVTQINKYIPTYQTASPRSTETVLEAMLPEDNCFCLVETNPTDLQIRSLIEELDWKNPTSVRMRRSNFDWLECSSDNSKGLAIRYAENGIANVAIVGPGAPSAFTSVLQLYRKDDPIWKTRFQWTPDS